ncbi:MAG TPA: MFS transporter [Actinomycetota bacterium]
MKRGTTLARAREVLESRDFRWLFATRIVSQLADGLFQAVIVASVVFGPDKQDTAVGFAKATAVLIVPYSVLGPFAGVLVDRWRRERILSLTPLVRAAAALLLLAGEHEFAPFYAGALIVLSGNRFFLVTAGTVTPKLVLGDDLLVANSMNSVGGTVSTIIGVSIGGLLADLAGFRPLLFACGALWLTASFMVRRIRTPLSAAVANGAGLETISAAVVRVAGELRDGARRLLRTPRALGPITSYTWDQFLQGLILVISFVVFRERFKEGVGSYSFLIGAGAVGGFVGLATVAWVDARVGRPRAVAVAFVVSGVPLLVVAPIISGVAVLVASFFLGLGFAWKKVPIDTMVQQSVPDRYRGRVFAVYDVAQNMARVVAALLAIVVVRESAVAVEVFVIGLAFVLYAPVLPLWIGRTVDVDVRSYAGSRADEVPRSIVLAGVEEPVEVERSWREERAGVRFLCFRLRLSDGSRLEVARPDPDGPWHIDRELPPQDAAPHSG